MKTISMTSYSNEIMKPYKDLAHHSENLKYALKDVTASLKDCEDYSIYYKALTEIQNQINDNLEKLSTISENLSFKVFLDVQKVLEQD